MVLSWNDTWARLRRGLRGAWQGARFVVRQRARRAGAARWPPRTLELQALARQLRDFERELGRARVGYARKQLSRQQLEQRCRDVVAQAQGLLQPLHLRALAAPGPSWVVERLREVLHRWHERADGLHARPLHPADVSEVQAQLLELSTALALCAHVEERDGGG
ncbi:hypothetical protein [Azohydromonas aeria]|uniref:hypothetical protein n=1 Tax=Azohydromonas aeria TaxID=2590212 RepID=UPI0012FA954F|nr:hypothetical protein [Azohydromonas aeria]